MAKSMKPGGGGRFAALVASGVPPGVAANAGRKKYGAKKMAKWAAAGRKRASHSHSQHNSYPHKYAGHV
jgi:hypothetical protein